jgi:hypothetical protein
MLNKENIPVIIINFNQLFFLKQNIEQLKKNDFKNIVIIDNNSSYPQLVDYYNTLKGVEIIRLNENLGHLVLYKKKELFERFCNGYYFLTDADIVLNYRMPKNFRDQMLKILLKNPFITKVGVALDISDIPNEYPLKKKVLKWESRFWQKEIDTNCFLSETDTTFALYRPKFKYNKFVDFYKSVRLAGDFTAKHGGGT